MPRQCDIGSHPACVRRCVHPTQPWPRTRTTSPSLETAGTSLDECALYGLVIPQSCDGQDIARSLARTGIIRTRIIVISRVTIRRQVLQRLTTTASRGIEDAALGLMALRNSGADPRALLDIQHRDGGWSAIPNVGPPSAFHTSLALLAIRPFQTASVRHAAGRAFDWLSELRGVESHWLWQWKFRLFDRQVRFDPLKSGWPWVPDTVSWVAPTALSILAFQAWCRESPRTAPAIAMLLDRACPQGGWNAGNSVVFGVDLDPHPDFTAMALLALRDGSPGYEALLNRSLDYLKARLEGSCSPYSLAWAVMALSAHGHEGAHRLKNRLERCAAAKLDQLPRHVLALVSLASEDIPFTFQEPSR